jgi:hypothetical protein
MMVTTTALVIRIDMILSARAGKKKTFTKPRPAHVDVYSRLFPAMEFYQSKVCKLRITGCGNDCRAAILIGLVRTDTIGSGHKMYWFRSRTIMRRR